MKRIRGSRLGILAVGAIGAACLISPQQAQAQFGVTIGSRRGGVSFWTGPPAVRHHGYFRDSGFRHRGYRKPARHWRGYNRGYHRGFYRGHSPRHFRRAPIHNPYRGFYHKPGKKFRRWR